MSGPDLVGWAATATFAVSYFCREPRTLRLVQAAAALMWLSYGVALDATPVIVANVIVFALALWSAWSPPRSLAVPTAESREEAAG
jgi:hypothetical protein